MIPPGTYEDVEITGSALKEGKNSDDPVVEIYFFLEGEPMTAWLYTTTAAWPWTEQKLRACGFDPKDHDFNLSALNLDGDANPVKGNRTRVVVKEEEYEGKIRSKVAWIGDAAGMTERLPDDQAVAFAQALRRRLLASAPKGKPSQPKPAAGRPTTRVTPPAPAAAPNTSEEPPW